MLQHHKQLSASPLLLHVTHKQFEVKERCSSIFNAYDDQKVQWGQSDMQTIRPKGNGSGIMVSDFVEESKGFLSLIDDSGKKKIARVLLEYVGTERVTGLQKNLCNKWTMLLLLPSPNILELNLFGYLTTAVAIMHMRIMH